MISAEIIANSRNPAGVRLVTWKLCYPRFIHSEIMTHRAFSRNAASSRAIPTAKWLEAVRGNPAMPVHFGANKAGMQAEAEVADPVAAEAWWRRGAALVADYVEEGARLGIHKQIVNRPLEAWMHMTVILSSTDYKGFFAQRAHPAAQPEFQALAYEMKRLYDESESQAEELQQREWHIPGVTKTERQSWDEPVSIQVSAARMAAVSYLRQEDERPLDKWMDVFQKLVGGDVLHLSPLEHPAMAAGHNARLSNFRGFHQLRARYDPYRE